jgi:hypothetical protein
MMRCSKDKKKNKKRWQRNKAIGASSYGVESRETEIGRQE